MSFGMMFTTAVCGARGGVRVHDALPEALAAHDRGGITLQCALGAMTSSPLETLPQSRHQSRNPARLQRFKSSIEAIKAEAITEFAAAESGLPVVRVTAASIKKGSG